MSEEDYTELLGKARLLELDTKGNPSSRFLRRAIVILLWQMANADGQVDPAEFSEIVRSMDHEFHIMDEDVGALLEEAQFFQSQSTDLDDLFKELNKNYSPKQRQYLFDMIWNIAKADGKIKIYERAFADHLRVKLLIPPDHKLTDQ